MKPRMDSGVWKCLPIRFIFAAAVAGGATVAAEYEVGGPLAGVKLPLFKTQHGEPPGHPGCIPGTEFESNQGLCPERELYPGAVEHYRDQLFKYCPTRNFFDKASMLENWIAPNIPGAKAEQVEQYASPVYWVPRHDEPVFTGKYLRPAPVVRCKVKSPVFELDLGERDIGLYAVRVIGAVETRDVQPFRKPLYVTMEVNDGLKGEVNTYRLRLNYCDEFYSVVEIYFHAVETRRFRAKLFVDHGSTVELLVHNVTLDDVLAGMDRRAIKMRRTLHRPATVKPGWKSRYTPDERLKRDAAIWDYYAPVNSQFGGPPHAWPKRGLSFGAQGQSREQVEAEHGVWEVPLPGYSIYATGLVTFTHEVDKLNVLLVNKKLGLEYTMDDYRAGRPLPDPYPYKDDGAGLYYPDPKNPKRGQAWCPVANALARRADGMVDRPLNSWVRTGDLDLARDAAVSLIRHAYGYPARDTATHSINWALTTDYGPYYGELRCRKRIGMDRWTNYQNYLHWAKYYDQLFDYLHGNEELARSIRRFVPWVKTSRDLIKLLDVYLVQEVARRILRYRNVTYSTSIITMATIVGETSVTDPWMDWAFDRVWVAPFPLVGLQDVLVTTNDRYGAGFGSSATFYAQVGTNRAASTPAHEIRKYLAAGGNPQYDLSRISAKAVDHCYWQLAVLLAGGDILRIGLVSGPTTPFGHLATYRNTRQAFDWGWRWTKRPAFAWGLAHLVGRTHQDDAEWQAILMAAQTQSQAPWLANRSRAVPWWAGVLETGHQHDDYRFRRAAYVATRLAHGWPHYDALDLQVIAHGVQATTDDGQRAGYTEPTSCTTRIHNVIEVDGQELRAHAWVQALSDIEGSQYLRTRGMPPKAARLFARQTALIDVDEGRGSVPLSPKQQIPGAQLPKGVVTPNSYVFDVFRVSGGKMHTYCFHAVPEDAFNWNATGVKPVAHLEKDDGTGSEAAYLVPFYLAPKSKAAGDAPALLHATWRAVRFKKDVKSENPYAQLVAEERYLGPNFDPDAPRKHTRLHLFGCEGARALKADVVSVKMGYRFTNLMVRKRSEDDLESAWPALVEPYVGQPFIVSREMLPITGNETDALRAVAVEVKTKNGHKDLCFADGRPHQTRTFTSQSPGPPRQFQVSGEFVFYSTDKKGLRLATLTGGTTLRGPEVRIHVSAGELKGRVVKVDYAKKQLWIDQRWPAFARSPEMRRGSGGGRVFEVGTGEHLTSYAATEVVPEDAGSRITVEFGADFYRSQISNVDPETGQVTCKLPPGPGKMPGLDQDWVASNEARTTFWRADYLGDLRFKLRGEPVTADDFEPEGVLRLWEYGVGDTVRRSTRVSVRRVGDGLFEAKLDVDATIGLKAKAVAASMDRERWRAAAGTRKGVWFHVEVGASEAAGGPVYLRIQ